jgi:hypothetical protein
MQGVSTSFPSGPDDEQVWRPVEPTGTRPPSALNVFSRTELWSIRTL